MFTEASRKNENKNILKLRQHIRGKCFRMETKCEQGCILSNYRKQKHAFMTKTTHTKRIQERRDMRKKMALCYYAFL